jgi:hypothetical protein
MRSAKRWFYFSDNWSIIFIFHRTAQFKQFIKAAKQRNSSVLNDLCNNCTSIAFEVDVHYEDT